MINTRQVFEHRYIHAPVKSATSERIELQSLCGRVRNLTAELSASAQLTYLVITKRIKAGPILSNWYNKSSTKPDLHKRDETQTHLIVNQAHDSILEHA